jgi:hypothetical protein
VSKSISINQALEFYGLDAVSITVSQVESAFRKLAQRHHPDKHLNFKDKLDAQEKFIFIQDTRELLLGALSSGALPIEDMPRDVWSSESGKRSGEEKVGPAEPGGAENASQFPNKPSFIGSLHPTLGNLVGWLVMPGLVFIMMGFALYVWALFIVLLPVYLFGGEKYLQRAKSNLMRYWGLWRSFFVMPFMLFFGASSAFMFGNGKETPTIAIFVAIGFTISWLFFEELYCWYKYRKNKVGLRLARQYDPE